MNRMHPFAGSAFDRLSERRNDIEWLKQLDSDRIRLVPVWRGRVLVETIQDTLRMSSLDHFITPSDIVESKILLGEFRDQVLFAVEIPEHIEPTVHAQAAYHDLRAVSGLLNYDELGVLGYARALIHWQRMHQFCGKCGARNQATHSGHVMMCSNEVCKQQNFPRLDPAVIVLVTDGERILLGRQTRFPPGRYSTIAGFVEWAESIEEAVVREVREEAGVAISVVEYHSSQPWPFPSSLMLGFVAQAVSTEIKLNDGELEDARWFTRQDIASGALSLPPTQSISFALIEHWYNQQGNRNLRNEPAAKIDRPEQLFAPAAK